MSPKSRGRPPGRGRPKNKTANRRDVPLRVTDRALRDTRELVAAPHVLAAEVWASEWLGSAWLAAGLEDREPDRTFILEIVGRAGGRGAAALAALHALRRVAAPRDHAELDEAIDALRESHRDPVWATAGAWRVTGAWRAVDVWASERVLMIDIDGTRPHTLMAVIHTVGGVMVDTLALLEPGAQSSWAEGNQDEVPMPMTPAPVDEVLADLADSLRRTDMYWPRQDDPGLVALRMLAWQRCRDHLPDLADWEPMADEERARLVEDFFGAATLEDTEATRRVAELIVDYGEGYLDGGVLAWSPASVMMFLVDFLPRKVVLDATERRVVPSVLRAWLHHALPARGVSPTWVLPVVEAVDEYLPEFEEAFDDESSWGPAKQIVAELSARGIDLTDRVAVEAGIGAVNARRLAESLVEGER